MNSSADLYIILGVSPNATPDDVRYAYRRAAQRFHPDKNSHPGAALQFRDIAAAYEVLDDPVARQEYDVRRRQSLTFEKPYFTLRMTPSKRVLPVLSEPQVLYLLVELLPDVTRGTRQVESNLNLTIIIDHSTSMKGARLERTKVAAHQLIDLLTPQDLLSVVTFSDRAEVLVPAGPVADKQGAKSRVSIMQAAGATEMLQGLDAGYRENQRYASKNYVNHMILITDGRTYGDEDQCLELGEAAAKEGIGISAMGIGEEWNDAFLDKLVSLTGGTSEYVNSPNVVVRFLNDRVRSLGKSFAERVTVSLAPDADIKVESAFRLTPSPQPVSIDTDPIPIGQFHRNGTASIVFQLQLPPDLPEGDRSILRVDATADIMRDQVLGYKVIGDSTVEVLQEPPSEEPPVAILDALGKLTLYRMQERAEAALARGDVQEATRHLENLATRLLSAGQEELANAAMAEARRVSHTNMFSEKGHKTLKYGTRLLLAANVPSSAPAVTGESGSPGANSGA
jgi:Ca-activated chloride channel homolog